MKNLQEEINIILDRVLREEIEKKSHEMSEKLKNSKLKPNKDTETKEGNAFGYEVQKAKKEGKKSFELDGKQYEVKEENKKWIQKTGMRKGELHKKLDVPEDEKIPVSKLKKLKHQLMDKSKGDAKLSKSDSTLLKQVNLALTLKDIKKESHDRNLRLTEEELISLIEGIIQEKNNIDTKVPKGLEYTEKILRKSKDENKDYYDEVVKKLKNYIKDGSKGEYSMNPKDFPRGNGELGEMSKKAYKASSAVEEYIEAFAYPGLENTNYDEIKPNEEKISEYIEGSSKSGNNPTWANAVETDLGKKINKKRKENLYQKEKDKSYNRVSQPVDEAGEGKGEDKLDKMFAQLESKESKNEILVLNEIKKMKNLFSYDQKTQ